MDLLWTTSGGASRSISFPTDNDTFTVAGILVEWTNVIALVLGALITVGTAAFLRFTKLGTAMRAMANDREITATLGVPVRRVEAAAWFGCGVLSGLAGILLADLVALDATTLTFLVLSSLAATLIARLRSISITFIAAIVVGTVDAMITPIQSITNYRDMTPFVFAAIALLFQNRRRVITVAAGRHRAHGRKPSETAATHRTVRPRFRGARALDPHGRAARDGAARRRAFCSCSCCSSCRRCSAPTT